ncbi:MAG: DUF58 domain-containing protein [Ruminococcaceae bacterium]|nr:DUF58 domain-containing protein [Oscillospiraceae bacterium]
MKKKNRKPRFISFRPGSIVYLILLLVSLVFTQALRSPASAILFIFLLFIPVLSIIYIVVARAGIKVYTECDNTRAEKGQTVAYEIKIINETPLPFPLVETIVSLPSENAVVCRDELLRITLLPMGCHIIENKVSFPLRGSYDIGVKYMHISDLFGLFKTELKLELHRTVIVYPRNIIMSADSSHSETDLPTSVTKRAVSPEQAEPSDIRNYIPGDSMKNIHWKLSSKSEELQVKNFSSNTDKHTYILCDLSFAGIDNDEDKQTNEKSSKAKKKTKRRRGKASQSAGVASAKSVGDAGGEAARKIDSRNTEERLTALGVTPEHISALDTLDDTSEIPVELLATRKGAKLREKAASMRIAKLAMIIGEDENSGRGGESHSPFNKESLPFAGELCADSTIELALSVMRYEVSRGAECTILYPDPRNDNGLGLLSSANDIPEDPSLIRFFTAPVCRNKEAFSELAMLIEQSAGMTIRMVTANTDINSAAVFAAIPAAFGGAGSGCTAEVLLSDPSDLWKSISDKGIAAQAMSEELSRSGVSMRQISVENGNDGNLRFTSAV